MRISLDRDLVVDRLGPCSSEQNKQRPVLVHFETLSDKRTFLKQRPQDRPEEAAAFRTDHQVRRQKQDHLE